jgi:hypothetical protein
MIVKLRTRTNGFCTRPYSPSALPSYLKSTPRFEFKGIPSDVFFFARASQPVLTFLFTVGMN